jgi:hypothetical protein
LAVKKNPKSSRRVPEEFQKNSRGVPEEFVEEFPKSSRRDVRKGKGRRVFAAPGFSETET